MDNLYFVDKSDKDWIFTYEIVKKKFIEKYDNDYWEFIVSKLKNMNNDIFKYLNKTSFKSCIKLKMERKEYVKVEKIYLVYYGFSNYKRNFNSGIENVYILNIENCVNKEKIIENYNIYRYHPDKSIESIYWFGWFAKNNFLKECDELPKDADNIVDLTLICKEDEYGMMQIKKFEKEPKINLYL